MGIKAHLTDWNVYVAPDGPPIVFPPNAPPYVLRWYGMPNTILVGDLYKSLKTLGAKMNVHEMKTMRKARLLVSRLIQLRKVRDNGATKKTT